MIAFVRFAFTFLIVVDSSIASKNSLLWVNDSRNTGAFFVTNDSTFINSILNLSLLVTPSLNFFFSFFVELAFHKYISASISSGKWIGISLFFQFIYTPLGATTMAVSISFCCQSQYILSIKTFDLPQPISIKYAKFFLS